MKLFQSPLLRRRSAAVPGLLLAASVLGTGMLWSCEAESRGEAQPRAVAPRGPLDSDERNNIDVFKRVSPSVVNITSLALQRDFFSLNVAQVPTGTGTGFVWDDAGHIVTNFHVIQEANAARVTLADQSSYRAELVGAFPDRDLAVLRIQSKTKLTPLALGASRDLQVGQKVFAIGNPFGLDQTMTTGIVSALNREIESVTRRTIRGVIQTDAAINPGNSGGPLLDSAGRLIGVNTAIYSPSGASSGIGFAIPVDEVNRIVPRLIRDGRIVRPSLGIAAGPQQLTEALKLPKGVALLRVSPGSPAQRAGLEPFVRARDGGIVAGDVITAVNNTPVADFDDLLNELERYQSGDTVTLSVWRAGKARQVSVKLAAGES
ncbi:S1C family serine protease [Azohydromonas caseinilytica]|uniref:PDZ domain-containing protein n=1 Tax=Azohydromonas caseinilytica TaxID=2728836 RepID=A0A848F850_9BURK|nr:trypsin-like peptidase domain-containing protein [Azohydromonas caseinilytica]NML14513.1 PDZ domain-containing protein [Azohydromonas caseinilytica]